MHENDYKYLIFTQKWMITSMTPVFIKNLKQFNKKKNNDNSYA